MQTLDICRRKHGGNEQSKAAFEKIKPGIKTQRQRVLDEVRRAGNNGVTCRELASDWGVGMNAVSGRFSELRRRRLIRADGKRVGCSVWVAIK